MTTICIISISLIMPYAPFLLSTMCIFYAPLIIVLYSKFNLHILKLQSCLIVCNPMDCSLPGSSVHGIIQARILEWVAISFSRGDLTDSGIKPMSLVAPTFQAESLFLSHLESPTTIPDKQIYRYRKQINGCQWLGKGRMLKRLLMGFFLD